MNSLRAWSTSRRGDWEKQATVFDVRVVWGTRAAAYCPGRYTRPQEMQYVDKHLLQEPLATVCLPRPILSPLSRIPRVCVSSNMGPPCFVPL